MFQCDGLRLDNALCQKSCMVCHGPDGGAVSVPAELPFQKRYPNTPHAPMPGTAEDRCGRGLHGGTAGCNRSATAPPPSRPITPQALRCPSSCRPESRVPIPAPLPPGAWSPDTAIMAVQPPRRRPAKRWAAIRRLPRSRSRRGTVQVRTGTVWHPARRAARRTAIGRRAGHATISLGGRPARRLSPVARLSTARSRRRRLETGACPPPPPPWRRVPWCAGT